MNTTSSIQGGKSKGNAPIPPYLSHPLEWITLTEFARRVKRPYITVISWLRDGRIYSFGPIYKTATGRYYIKYQ